MEDYQESARRNRIYCSASSSLPPRSSTSTSTAPASSMSVIYPQWPALISVSGGNFLPSPRQWNNWPLALPRFVFPPESPWYMHHFQNLFLNANAHSFAVPPIPNQPPSVETSQRQFRSIRPAIAGASPQQYVPSQYSTFVYPHIHCQAPGSPLTSNVLPPNMSPSTVEGHTFIPEKIETGQKKPRKKRGQKQEEDMLATKNAGGACTWCYFKKKRCGSNIPCDLCVESKTICIRNASSLCLPSTTLRNSQLQMRVENFEEPRIILNQLRSGISLRKPSAHDLIYIDWASGDCTRQFENTWSGYFDQFDLDEIDADVKASLLKLARLCVPISQLNQAAYAHPLYKDACLMFRLFATIETFTRSKISVQPMAVDISRIAIFFNLTIYAMEICEVSIRFAARLNEEVRAKRSGDDAVRCSIIIYSRVVDKIGRFQQQQQPDSSMSGLFRQIESRLKSIQDAIQEILRLPSNGQSVVIPDVIEILPFNIAIGLEPKCQSRTPTELFRQDTPHFQWEHGVDELLSRNHNKMIPAGSYSPERTIDPRVLLFQTTPWGYTANVQPPSSSPSTTNDNGFNDIFSDPQEGSGFTYTTYNQPDDQPLPDPIEQSNSGDINDGTDAAYDIFAFGNHLLHGTTDDDYDNDCDEY